MTPDELGLDVQIEVAATPEQVWEAISTGPGISAWFLPAEVEGERITFHHMPGGSSEAEVTDAEPPRRLRFTEDGGAQATEFLVEARSGGTCVVRVVGSGFGGKGADDGWTAALLGLKLYLEHFAGQEAANVLAGGQVAGPQARAWEELRSAVGLGDPAEGARVTASAGGAPPLAGVVEGKLDTMVTLRLERARARAGFRRRRRPGRRDRVRDPAGAVLRARGRRDRRARRAGLAGAAGSRANGGQVADRPGGTPTSLLSAAAVRYATNTRPSRAGTSVIDRRATRSGTSASGSSRSQRRASTRSTAAISNWAKLAPRQRRTPPPNGIQV